MLPIKPLDISDTTNKALHNLSDKSTTIIGDMLADFLSVPATKVHYWAEKHNLIEKKNFDFFVNSLSQNLSAIPINKTISPQLQLLSSVSEDVVHCVNSKELCNMFASLLANGCNIDYATFIHPSFSSTLKQMSPYDAKLFKEIYSNLDLYNYAAEYIILTDNSPDHLVLHECIVSVKEPFNDFNMQSMSISALKHLGLISYTDSQPASPGESFEKCNYFQGLLKKYAGTDSRPITRRVQLFLTPYGESFAKTCLTSSNN